MVAGIAGEYFEKLGTSDMELLRRLHPGIQSL
jgi:hypothetical protein